MRSHRSPVPTVLHAAALAIALCACSEGRESRTAPAARPSARGPSARDAAGRAPALAIPPAPGGPRLGTAREIRGYFRSATAPETLRLWVGPNDAPGWERLTKLVATVDGEPVFSMAVSAIRPAGLCRSTAAGLDQVLLSFNREPQGRKGAGVLWYDAERRRFSVRFFQEDITLDPLDHFDCAAGRSLFPEGAPARPCLCPWRDSPAGAGEPATPSGAPGAGEAGEVLVSPEATGQPETGP